MGLSAIVPIVHGLLVFGKGHLNRTISLNWLVAQGLVYIMGAIIYANRVPERLKPGVFDNVGASHQIFHVFVLIAASLHLVGLVKAFHQKHSGPFAAAKLIKPAKVERKE
jgi:adiponectin receptor